MPANNSQIWFSDLGQVGPPGPPLPPGVGFGTVPLVSSFDITPCSDLLGPPVGKRTLESYLCAIENKVLKYFQPSSITPGVVVGLGGNTPVLDLLSWGPDNYASSAAIGPGFKPLTLQQALNRPYLSPQPVPAPNDSLRRYEIATGAGPDPVGTFAQVGQGFLVFPRYLARIASSPATTQRLLSFVHTGFDTTGPQSGVIGYNDFADVSTPDYGAPGSVLESKYSYDIFTGNINNDYGNYFRFTAPAGGRWVLSGSLPIEFNLTAAVGVATTQNCYCRAMLQSADGSSVQLALESIGGAAYGTPVELGTFGQPIVVRFESPPLNLLKGEFVDFAWEVVLPAGGSAVVRGLQSNNWIAGQLIGV